MTIKCIISVLTRSRRYATLMWYVDNIPYWPYRDAIKFGWLIVDRKLAAICVIEYCKLQRRVKDGMGQVAPNCRGVLQISVFHFNISSCLIISEVFAAVSWRTSSLGNASPSPASPGCLIQWIALVPYPWVLRKGSSHTHSDHSMPMCKKAKNNTTTTTTTKPMISTVHWSWTHDKHRPIAKLFSLNVINIMSLVCMPPSLTDHWVFRTCWPKSFLQLKMLEPSTDKYTVDSRYQSIFWGLCLCTLSRTIVWSPFSSRLKCRWERCRHSIYLL